jgi:RNA polymerase sigma-70 factor (ECF subfamily)
MTDPSELDERGDDEADLQASRPAVFAVAYRMLGSVADAEDVVQEAQLRLHRARRDGAQIENPRAFSIAVATRLAIDHLRSARARRETYVGTWLPEPLVEGEEPSPGESVEIAESLSMAFLVLLETLAPVERAVFLLREVFDYDYKDIAAIVQKSEANCRQVFARAKRHVDAGKPRFEPAPEQREELARRFFAACQEGRLDELLDLLATDASFFGDGGGKAVAVAHPLHGRERVARFVMGIVGKGAQVGARLEPRTVNGQPGAVVLDREDRVIYVLALDIAEGAVRAVRSVVNPDKLGHLGPVSDVARVDA